MEKFEQEINCPLCNEKSFLKHKKTSLLKGLIILNKNFYYWCPNCKEEFSSAEQVREVSKKLNLLKNGM